MIIQPNRPVDAGINLALQAAEARRVKAVQLREKLNRLGGGYVAPAKLPPPWIDTERAARIKSMFFTGGCTYEEATRGFINCGIPEEELTPDSPWFKEATPNQKLAAEPAQASPPAAKQIEAQLTDSPIPFQLKDNSKAPARKGYQKTEHGEFTPAGNTGYLLNKDDLVLDCDRRNYPAGRNMYVELITVLPETKSVQTPNGVHLYYKMAEPIKPKKNQPHLPGVDILTHPRYVVGPPSVIDGNAYRLMNDLPVATIPPEFLNSLELQDELNSTAESEGVKTLSMLPQFIDTCKIMEGFTEGNYSDDKMLAHILHGRDLGLDEEHIYDAIWNYLAPRCQMKSGKPFTEAWIKQKITNAFKSAKGMQGFETPDAVFKDVPLPEPDTTGNATSKESEVEQKPEPEYIDGIEMLERVFPEQRYAVEGVLPVGFTVCGAHPKSKKTFLALNLAVSISVGTPALGKFVAGRGKVLCLFFEDSKPSIQERYGRILDEIPATRDIEFCYDFPTGKPGLDELVKKLKANSDICAVIVDTLGLFLPVPASKLNAYQNEYPLYSALNRIALKYNVAIFATHHLAKDSRNTDPVTQLTGSMALAAAASALWVLKPLPTNDMAQLYIIPKEFERRVLVLKFNSENLMWEYQGIDAAEIQLSEHRQKIVDFIRINGKPTSPKEIADGLQMEAKNVKSMLWKMVHKGELLKKGHGRYAVKDVAAVFEKVLKKIPDYAPPDEVEAKRKTREALRALL